MAGILGALVLILITAYYMAIRPEPLVNGLVRLAPPPRREHVRHVLAQQRQSWIGWLEGVVIDMLVTGVMVYVALTIVGLDFAIFFAVLSALLVVVPYFGAIAGAIPPVLFALTDSPGKAILALGAYILVQQLESNVTIPIIMAQRVRLHPAVIAIGVVVVGQLFGFVGLFVAVPILSLIIITVEEFWVKPVEEGHAEHRRSELELPETLEQQLAPDPEQGEALRSGQLRDRDHHADQHEDHDQDLHDDQSGAAPRPECLLDDRLAERDGHRVHARIGLELQDRALRVGLDRLRAEPDASRDLLRVEALGDS